MFDVDDIHGGSLLFIFSLLIHFAMRLLVSKTWRSKVPVKVQFWFIEQIHAFTRVVTGKTLWFFINVDCRKANRLVHSSKCTPGNLYRSLCLCEGQMKKHDEGLILGALLHAIDLVCHMFVFWISCEENYHQVPPFISPLPGHPEPQTRICFR